MLGPKRTYVSLMDEAIVAKAEKDKQNKMSFPLRPSSAGKCSRKLAYELNAYNGNEPQTHEERRPHIQRLLAYGHSSEYHLLKFLDGIDGFSVRFRQQTVSMFKLERDGRMIEGSTDAVMWSSDHKGLLDVKTVGDRYYSGYETKWKGMFAKYDDLAARGLCERIDEHGFWIPDVVPFLAALASDDSLHDNIPQINLYAMTEFMQERGIDHGVVMRYLKNSSECMELRFALSKELFEITRKKFNVVDQAVAAGKPELAPKDQVLGSMACGFCPFKARCWPEKDALKEYFKTFPKREWPVRLSDLEDQENLQAMFTELKQDAFAVEKKKILEEKIIKAMVSQEVEKIKLDDDTMYAVVALKSPYPHFELRKVTK